MKTGLMTREKFFWNLPSPLGTIILAESGGELTNLFFLDPREGERIEKEALKTPSVPLTLRDLTTTIVARRSRTPILEESRRQIEEYFAGKRTRFDLPIAPDGGTPFQRSVWRAISGVPFGETVTYGEVARSIGRPTASRAVGGGVHVNPIAIIIPCHRVLGANGRITGYASGLDRKRFLLRLEGISWRE